MLEISSSWRYQDEDNPKEVLVRSFEADVNGQGWHPGPFPLLGIITKKSMTVPDKNDPDKTEIAIAYIVKPFPVFLDFDETPSESLARMTEVLTEEVDARLSARLILDPDFEGFIFSSEVWTITRDSTQIQQFLDQLTELRDGIESHPDSVEGRVVLGSYRDGDMFYLSRERNTHGSIDHITVEKLPPHTPLAPSTIPHSLRKLTNIAVEMLTLK